MQPSHTNHGDHGVSSRGTSFDTRRRQDKAAGGLGKRRLVRSEGPSAEQELRNAVSNGFDTARNCIDQ
eukprot:15476243-Alexandrium_andersonii.AAC.1